MKPTKMNTGNFCRKTLLIIFIFTSGLSGFIKCNGQSVVGKWQRDLTIWYELDKSTGKQVPISPEKQKQFDQAMASRNYKEILEFKSDGTYTSTATAEGETKSHTEHYTLSGKNLDLNIPLVKGEKTTITIETLTSDKMIWNLYFMNKLTGIGYKRI
jgi:Lipocalin-like domain